MAFACSIHNGQIPVNCNLCDEDPKIKFKCKDCDMLLCRNCKEKKHVKFKNAADHMLIDIKDIGTMEDEDDFRFSDVKCQEHNDQSCCLFCKTCNKLICLKCIPRIHNGHYFIDEETFNTNNKMSVIEERKIVNPSLDKKIDIRRTGKPELTITRQFVTLLRNIHSMVVCKDGSLWLCDRFKDRIQHVKLGDKDIQIISNINTVVWYMAVTSSGDILLSGKTSLKQIRDNKIINTKYNTYPLITGGIHVTSDNKVIICAISPGPIFHRLVRHVVIVMDQEGNTTKEYKYDKTNTPLITFPVHVTCTSNGNICVVDRLDNTSRGRVVILSQGEDVISVYTGHHDINKDKPFTPQGIVTTQSDNIIITDTANHSLHILNSSGQFITYFRLYDMGISFPCSLAFTGLNKLYIGCVSSKESTDTFRSKLYEITYCGF